MKVSGLKNMIKEAVREVIQEELKDILLEAVRTPKQQVIKEHSLPQVDISSKPNEVTMDMREKYMSVLDNMATSFTSQDAKPKFRPNPGTDTINGSLPDGEVGMDQIMNLLNK